MSDFAKEAAPDATGKCGELVTVKPLEWNPFRAETPFGYYSVDDQTDRDEKELRGRPPFLLSGSRVGLQRFWTLEEARAAAQAHFNARVLSLVTRSQAEELLAAERAEKEKERLRFEGDLDKWMKIIGAGITGYQPEAYTLMDFACEELVKLRTDNAALTAQTDAYGIALMLIREGCENPSDIARNALERFGK